MSALSRLPWADELAAALHGGEYYLLGDAIYPVYKYLWLHSSKVCDAFVAAVWGSIRATIENAFGETAELGRRMRAPISSKRELPARLFMIAALVRNMLTCIRGRCQGAVKYNVNPPELEEYLALGVAFTATGARRFWFE